MALRYSTGARARHTTINCQIWSPVMSSNPCPQNVYISLRSRGFLALKVQYLLQKGHAPLILVVSDEPALKPSTVSPETQLHIFWELSFLRTEKATNSPGLFALCHRVRQTTPPLAELCQSAGYQQHNNCGISTHSTTAAPQKVGTKQRDPHQWTRR